MHDGSGDAPVESITSAAASAHISHAVIATYAAAAAIEVAGVHAIAGGGVDPDRVPKGVRISSDGDAVGLELHLVTEWGASIPAVAGEVSSHVRDYLVSMIELEPSSVAVVIDDVAPPAS